MAKNKYELSWGGVNASRSFKHRVALINDFQSKWHLSTEGYYFKYRADRNNPALRRATLYRASDNSQVDDVAVSSGCGLPEKSHHDVINYFEARLTLKQIG